MKASWPPSGFAGTGVAEVGITPAPSTALREARRQVEIPDLPVDLVARTKPAEQRRADLLEAGNRATHALVLNAISDVFANGKTAGAFDVEDPEATAGLCWASTHGFDPDFRGGPRQPMPGSSARHSSYSAQLPASSATRPADTRHAQIAQFGSDGVRIARPDQCAGPADRDREPQRGLVTERGPGACIGR